MGILKYYYCPYGADIFLNQLANFLKGGGQEDAFQISETKTVDVYKPTGDGKKMGKRDTKKTKTTKASKEEKKATDWRKKVMKLYADEPKKVAKKVKKVAKKTLSKTPKKPKAPKPISQKEVDRRALLTCKQANEIDSSIKKMEKTIKLCKDKLKVFDSVDKKIRGFHDKIAFFNKIVDNFKNNINECKTHTQVLKHGAEAVEFLKDDLHSIYGLFDTQNAILEHHLNITSQVEETLVQVLLAIRQNEYLQAWHPESLEEKLRENPYFPYDWAAARQQRLPQH